MRITLPSSCFVSHKLQNRLRSLRLVLRKSNAFDDAELLLNNEQFHPLLLLQIITMQVLVFLLTCFESHQGKKKQKQNPKWTP